jgi:hypothetical protein
MLQSSLKELIDSCRMMFSLCLKNKFRRAGLTEAKSGDSSLEFWQLICIKSIASDF